MAPRGKHTSVEIRQLIVKLNLEGKTVREISKLVGKSKSAVHDIIKRFRDEFRLANKSREDQSRILNEREERSMLKEIKQDPFKTAKELKISLKCRTGKDVCLNTIRNTLHKYDYYGRFARKKPFISPKNKNHRIKFAKEYLLKTEDFWNQVLFTDKSKFNLHGKHYVWRKPNSEFNHQNTKATIKHGGGSVMVWGCMSSAGVSNLHFIDSKMDKLVYFNILTQNVKQSAEKLGIANNFAFYQDNDPKHTSAVAKLWLIHNCPKLIETLAQSPDLKGIEHLWEELCRRGYQKKFNTLDLLKAALLEAWSSIEPEVCQNLVKSIPKRLQAVLDSKGYATKY